MRCAKMARYDSSDRMFELRPFDLPLDDDGNGCCKSQTRLQGQGRRVGVAWMFEMFQSPFLVVEVGIRERQSEDHGASWLLGTLDPKSKKLCI